MAEKEQLRSEWTVSSKHLIIIIFIIAVILRVLTVINYGESLKLFMDDRHYVNGAINFLKTGHVAGNPLDEPTVISMPGMFLWLAGLMKIFGYTQVGLECIRISLGIMDAISALGIYKLFKYTLGEKIALLAAVFYAIGIPFICNSVLTMTESITVFGIVWFLYFAIKFCDTRKNKDFFLMFFFYFFALLTRPTVALLPAILIFYYWKKQFPIKLLLSRCVYAIALISVLLSPWWYRNYLVTGQFLPTTVGGDALLGGTYYFDATLENEISFEETREEFYDPEEEAAFYKRMERQAEYGVQRIKEMWKADKMDFLKTYLIKKPYLSWVSTTRRGIIFDIGAQALDRIHQVFLGLAAIGAIVGLLRKKTRNGTGICLCGILYFSIFTSVFLPFPGYNFPAYFFVITLAAIAVEAAIKIANKAWEKVQTIRSN